MDPNAMLAADPPVTPTVTAQDFLDYRNRTNASLQQIHTMLQQLDARFTAQQVNVTPIAVAPPPAAPLPTPGPNVSTAIEKSKLKKIDGKAPKFLQAWFNAARAYILGHQSMGAACLDTPNSVFFVSTHFDGELMAWWSAQQETSGDFLAGGFDNFAQIEDAVLSLYRIVDPKEDARLKLVSLNQTGSIEDYCMKVVQLNARLGTTRSVEDKVKFFIHGLKQYEKEYVTRAQPKTLEESIALATEAARLYDTARPGRRLFGNRAGGSNSAPMDLDALLVERARDAVLSSLGAQRGSGSSRNHNRPRYLVTLPAAERQRRMANHLCFICGKKHLIHECDQLEAALKDGRARRAPN
jgi:hypothetical protein